LGLCCIYGTTEKLVKINKRALNDAPKLIGDVALSYLIGSIAAEMRARIIEMITLFALYSVAKGFSLWGNWVGAGITFGIKLATQFLLLYIDWDSAGKMLVNGIMGIILGLIAIRANLAQAFLDFLVRSLKGGVVAVLYLLYNGGVAVVEPMQHVRTLADWIELAIDFLFAAAALVRFRILVD
jgi:hypothetical protein